MKKRIHVTYVEQLQNGDMKALAEIYQFYKAPLYYFALSMIKNPIDAEEVIQEVFLKVQKNISQLKNVHSFHTWLFSITYNETLRKQHIKTKQIEVNDDYNIEEHVIAKDNQKTVLNNITLMEVIHDSFQKLSKKNKITAELRFIGGLSLKEIAEELHIPIGVVKSRIFTIRKLVSKDLEKKGYSPRKYFSFIAIPLLYQIMNAAYNNQINKGFLYALGKPLLPTFKSFLIGFSLCSVCIIFVGYIINPYFLHENENIVTQNQEVKKIFHNNHWINQIVYNQTPSRTPVEIKVELFTNITDETIQILLENEPIESKLVGNTIIFYASTNGKYRIQIEDEERILLIDNICPYQPILLEAQVYKESILFIIDDPHNQIDYETSYILYDNSYLLFPEKLQINGNYYGQLTVKLQDKQGIEKYYTFALPKKEEELHLQQTK